MVMKHRHTMKAHHTGASLRHVHLKIKMNTLRRKIKKMGTPPSHWGPTNHGDFFKAPLGRLSCTDGATKVPILSPGVLQAFKQTHQRRTMLEQLSED